jgi:hypothetical protein
LIRATIALCEPAKGLSVDMRLTGDQAVIEGKSRRFAGTTMRGIKRTERLGDRLILYCTQEKQEKPDEHCRHPSVPV